MFVIKRDGRQEPLQFDKLKATLKKLSYGLSEDHCDPVLVAQKVYFGVYNVSESAAETAAVLLCIKRSPLKLLSSCFLLSLKDNNIDSIYDTLKECAVISKSAGGIGLSIHNIHATSSYLTEANETSNGIIPMLQVFQDTARYIDQGGRKRKGAFAVYLEPWHADIFKFLDLRKSHGKVLTVRCCQANLLPLCITFQELFKF
ncbi:hypothetical protein COLO4_38006 [Corchorus olitorius]|uniref:ATP-cone domain-containing protein n=1 Tax=Corchorus olitorius TaxID=93759 RepID=A0A1R3FXL8_9ROSI|nr:hypothetical protein COLO4_38006 [Corchorus olitorius]